MSDDIDEFIEELFKHAKSVIVSNDPSEPFIILEREGGLVYLTFDEGGEEVRALEIPIGRVASLEYFLQDQLSRFVKRRAILTVGCVGGSGKPYIHRWDVNRGETHVRLLQGALYNAYCENILVPGFQRPCKHSTPELYR